MKILHILIMHIFAMLFCNLAMAQPCPVKTDMKHTEPSTRIFDVPVITTKPTGPEGIVSLAPEDKLIYWVHGMRGGNGSWSNVATATENNTFLNPIPGYPARKAISYRISYEIMKIP